MKSANVSAAIRSIPQTLGEVAAPIADGRPGESSSSPLQPSDQRFSAAVAALTAAFGDPTRREIYLYVRSMPGATATEVASKFSLHPNVARHHLDRLSAGGYLEVTVQRPAAGAGRPAKHYRSATHRAKELGAQILGHRDDLLVSLLTESLDLLGPAAAEKMAESVGEAYGRKLAGQMEPAVGQRSVRAAMHAVADALTANGFDARAEDRGAATAVVAGCCPFGEAAAEHPVLCAVDRGLIRGLLAGLCGESKDHPVAVVLSSRARGDATCAALA